MVSKLSDVSDVVKQTTNDPRKSFPKILKLASSEDWKEREWANGGNAHTAWIIKDGLR